MVDFTKKSTSLY